MKKLCFILLSLLMLSTLVLAACKEDSAESSAPASESSVASQEASVSTPSEEGDSSEAESATESETETENSEPNEGSSAENPPEIEGSVKIVSASFSEKPYFALIGQCKEGATVKGVCNGETVTSKSYKGWFSLRLRCSGSSAEVVISQTVEGTDFDQPRTFTVKPKTPGGDMWPVIAGGDMQFFFEKMLPDFRGQNIPAQYLFGNLSTRVTNRLKEMRSYNPNAEIIYLVVPSSLTVYPELLPASYGGGAAETRLDKTMEALEAGGATVINLKELFAEHKNDDKPLYYKLDSHWTDYGAYVAYNALFEHIAKKYPDAAPRAIDEFNWNGDYYESGDMTYYLETNASTATAAQKNIPEYSYYRTPKFEIPGSIFRVDRYRRETSLVYSDRATYENILQTNRPNLPSCVVLRDSYSTQMYDILAERMDQTHYLGMWNYSWDKALISQEQPDYVIYIIAEWNLDSVIYG